MIRFKTFLAGFGLAFGFFALVAGTTNFVGRVIVQDGAAPTCSVATGEGDLCVEDALEVKGVLAMGGNTLTLANGQTIVGDTNNEIQLGDGTEDISFGFGTSNECDVSTDTGVTRVDYGSIGVKTAAPMMLLNTWEFCGQGANGATASYIGPILRSLADDMRSYIYGAAGCDGLDNTTEATADAPLEEWADIKIVGMMCTITGAGGTDDAYVFQLRDDTANVTGVTCTATLAGATQQTCTVILDEPVTVASQSAMAVKETATNDNCSACDTGCRIFYTY